ncbi:hypothetical protein K1719_046436 [Acacia pycnantha]|nr:hypothetical protein K1719_046436 [Acacia pycnantha]
MKLRSLRQRLRLENPLNTWSSHCSDDGLKAKMHSLQQEIQIVLSSFKQAYNTSDIVTKLEQKEKLMIGQSSHQKGAAMTLLSEIHKTQTREAELKEKIYKLQAELHSKEKEIKQCEVKLLSLVEQKKKSVSDTMGFIKELEAVKKEIRSKLENVNSKWSSCLANLKKTSLMLGVHLKQKL